MEFFKRSISVILIFSLLLVSCTNDDVAELSPAPELPPLSTLVMDFSNFDANAKKGGRTMANDNWRHAALSAGFWNVIIGFNLAIPVASFKTAVAQKANFNVDRQLWIWSYDYKFVGKTYTSELTAKLDGDVVNWEMYISEENGFQNVLWFKGSSALNGKNGQWILNKDAEDPIAYLQIDWLREGENIGSIKYTDVSKGKSEGSFIKYGRSTDANFDLFYTISSTALSNQVDIEWNEANGNGRVKNPAHFEDDKWRCWNVKFEDIDC